MFDPLLNVDQTAKVLGLSKFTIRAMINQRRIPFIRLGRRILFSKDTLETFIKQNEVEAKERT